MTSGKLTHIDAAGRARMVDVSDKAATTRRAVAEGRVTMNHAAFIAVRDASGPKGDVRAAAEIAGVMAAKRTADLIPLCHPLPLTGVRVEVSPLPDESGFSVRAEAKTTAGTGVEMEALTAAAVACLTLYDMAKALDREMEIGGVRLLEKSGGRSGDWRRGGA